MGWQAESAGDLTGRRVVVTGGNSGVGFEAARLLLQRGADVVLACRDPQRAESARAELATAGRGAVSTAELDLADLDSVAGFAERFAATHARLDALVNNAGVMGGARMATAQGFERQMGTNHLGHFALTARLWPQLSAAPEGRVVALSSVAARGGQLDAAMAEATLVDPQPYRPSRVYSNTKQANLLFAQELHRRVQAAGSPVRAIAAHPGVSWTNLFLRQLREEGRGWLAPPARVFAPLVLQSAAAGALPTLRAVADPGVPSGAFVGPKSFGQWRGAPELLDVYPQGADAATAARLWELSEALTGLTLRP